MFGTLKNAYDLAKDLTALQVSTEFKTKINDLLAALFTAREEAMAVQEENMSLKGKVRDLEAQLATKADWEGERNQYELKPVMTGNYAYFLKSGVGSDQPYCQNCFDHERKSPLQIKRLASLIDYKCPSCSVRFGGMS